MRLVTIISFTHIHDLALARGPLEQEGIQCFVKDEFTMQANPLYDAAIGGIKLQVPERDAARAIEILQGLGYLRDEEEEPSEFLATLNRKTARVPILNNLPPVFRLLAIIVAFSAILIVSLLIIVGKDAPI